MGIDEQLLQHLNKLRGSRAVIVGIGNVLKGDDGAGPILCEQLQRKGTRAGIIDAGTVPENYIQTIVGKAPANLLIIDAMDFGGAAGAISVFKPEQLSSAALSTHTLSPRLFAEIVCRNIRDSDSAKGEPDVYFVGIQPAQTQLGQAVSEPVNQAIHQLSHVLIELFPPKD